MPDSRDQPVLARTCPLVRLVGDTGSRGGRMTVTVRPDGTSTVVELTGDLDFGQVNKIMDTVTNAVDSSAIPVVVDAAGVTFVDSTGLGLLIAMHNRARQGLTIRNPPARLLQLATITGMDRTLKFETP